MPAMDLRTSVRGWVMQLPGLPDCRTLGGAVGKKKNRSEVLVSSVTNDIVRAGDDFYADLKATCRTYLDLQRRLTKLWVHPAAVKPKAADAKEPGAAVDQDEIAAQAAANFYAVRRPVRTMSVARANRVWAAILEAPGKHSASSDGHSAAATDASSNSSCEAPSDSGSSLARAAKRVQFLEPGLEVAAANIRIVPALNGRRGLVHDVDSCADRVSVKFPEPHGIVSLRRCNLLAAAAPKQVTALSAPAAAVSFFVSGAALMKQGTEKEEAHQAGAEVSNW
ncbi:hypothetical protein DIPPA_09679 [Diplonema papillatum]|nr:hypothetical protein DIPPA_09679 [Diplonema papillatum]